MPRDNILPCFKDGTDVQSSIDQLQQQHGVWFYEAHVILEAKSSAGDKATADDDCSVHMHQSCYLDTKGWQACTTCWTDAAYLKGVHLSAGLTLCILLLLQ